MAELPILLSGYSLEPWSRCIPSLAVARGCQPRVGLPLHLGRDAAVELEANPLMLWIRWGRTALIILRKPFQELGGDGTRDFGNLVGRGRGKEPETTDFRRGTITKGRPRAGHSNQGQVPVRRKKKDERSI